MLGEVIDRKQVVVSLRSDPDPSVNPRVGSGSGEAEIGRYLANRVQV
jgi:hypothetical protein